MRSLKIFKKNVGVFYLRIKGFGEKRRRFIKLVNTNLEQLLFLPIEVLMK